VRKYFRPFFSEGSCRLKLIWASLPFRGLDGQVKHFPTVDFSGSSSVKMPQVKNRLPRFPIQAYSAPVGFEKESLQISFSKFQ